mmetsp:Transcript_21263/g.43211  ORF Transcript_21263/g.43211 Transcript_21263/m.43211 type:complete len:114 (+) Transcript_21263:801-1142(+)
MIDSDSTFHQRSTSQNLPGICSVGGRRPRIRTLSDSTRPTTRTGAMAPSKTTWQRFLMATTTAMPTTKCDVSNEAKEVEFVSIDFGIIESEPCLLVTMQRLIYKHNLFGACPQ